MSDLLSLLQLYPKPRRGGSRVFMGFVLKIACLAYIMSCRHCIHADIRDLIGREVWLDSVAAGISSSRDTSLAGDQEYRL